MTDPRHTASANPNAPGHVSIKLLGTTIMSFWAWDLMVATMHAKQDGTVQLIFRDRTTMWLPTTASVAEVMTAVSAAMAANAAVAKQQQSAKAA
jgi:hypothetical protein